MKIKDFVYFYRIRTWKNKNTWLTTLMYAFFGYIVASNFNPFLIAINTLVLSGIAMCLFALNNLFDFKLNGENNFIGEQIKKGLSYKKALIYSFAPLLTFPLVLFTNITATVLALTVLILGLFYTLPSFRAKDKKYGWLLNAVGVGVVFLQAYFAIGGVLNTTIIMLLVIILLFHTYVDCFHILADHKLRETKIEIKKIKKLVRSMPIVSLLISLLFAIFNPIFLITSFFSLVRLKALRKIDSTDHCKIRFSAFGPFISPLYSSYEFAVYGVWFLL